MLVLSVVLLLLQPLPTSQGENEVINIRAGKDGYKTTLSQTSGIWQQIDM